MNQGLNENDYEISMKTAGLVTTSYHLTYITPTERTKKASARLSVLAHFFGYENLALQRSFSKQTGLPRSLIKRLVQRDLEGKVS